MESVLWRAFDPQRYAVAAAANAAARSGGRLSAGVPDPPAELACACATMEDYFEDFKARFQSKRRDGSAPRAAINASHRAGVPLAARG